MTSHQLTLLAVIGTAACWGAFALAWLLGAILYEPQAPTERTRSRFGTAVAVWPGLVIVIAVDLAVPRSAWHAVALHPAWIRILGLAGWSCRFRHSRLPNRHAPQMPAM
jgi:hypothetical protein